MAGARTISLDVAVGQIHQACVEAKNDGSPSPFFFIIGAGVSHPPIPLADEIVRQCRDKAFRKDPPGLPGPMNEYSHWFDQAYPQARQRQRYLRGLIEGKSVSQANFRLAHLLLSEDPKAVPVANLVVTSNFDDFLTRALTAFGKRHVVCDHPATAIRVDPDDRETIQIVHVHGSYAFYDCTNLAGEIEEMALLSETTVLTMASFLDAALRHRSPLVVGYSGWDGDVLMKALHRRVQNTQALPWNLYWFAYRAEEVARLPNWLRNHASVRFVVKERAETEAPAAGGGTSGQTEAPPQVSPQGQEAAQPKGGQIGALTAREVLDALIQEFEVPDLRLTLDPLGFFQGNLKEVFPSEDLSSAAQSGVVTEASGIYSLHRVIEHISAARTWLEGESARGGDRLMDLMNEVQSALRRARYRDALRAAGQIEIGAVPPRVREELIDLLFIGAVGLLDDSEDELRAYQMISELGEGTQGLSPESRLRVATAGRFEGLTYSAHDRQDDAIAAYDRVTARFGDAGEPVLRVQVAMSLVNKGVALRQLGRSEEAMSVYDQVVARFGDAGDPALREQVAMALVNKGIALGQGGRREDEIAAYDDAITRFGDAGEPAVREQVAKALFNKGFALGQVGRSEDEIAAYDDVVTRFGDAEEAALRVQVARALFNKGVELRERGRSEEAISVYDQVVARFGGAGEPGAPEQVAKALVNKGVVLRQLGRSEEAISVYDQVVARFGSAGGEALREQVAMALVNKGVALAKGDHPDDGIAVYNDVVTRFGDAREAPLRVQVAAALVNKGIALGEMGRSEDEIAAYDDVVTRFGDAAERALRVRVAMALVNKGITLGQMSRGEEAIGVYDQVMRFAEGGETGLQEQIARALLSRGVLLKQLGRIGDAQQSFKEIINRFGQVANDELAALVAEARRQQGDSV